MKTIAAAAALFLSASAALAEAPCENPVAPPCQKACAAMAAKLVLATRRPSLQPVSTGDADAVGTTEGVQKLARLSGLTIDELERMPLSGLRRAVVSYCRK
jgi:hypothetical protein